MDRTLVAAVVGAFLTVGTTPVFAAHQDILGHTVPDSTAEGWGDGRTSGSATSDVAGGSLLTQQALGQMGRKLGRGLVNASTGWMELPKEMYRISQERNPAFGVILGSFLGLRPLTVRTLAGIYEAATFPVPIPAGYAPVVRPATVFTWEKLSLENPSSSWEARG